jgi:hypothetical protein
LKQRSVAVSARRPQWSKPLKKPKWLRAAFNLSVAQMYGSYEERGRRRRAPRFSFAGCRSSANSCHPERTGPQTLFSLGVVSRRICFCSCNGGSRVPHPSTASSWMGGRPRTEQSSRFVTGHDSGHPLGRVPKQEVLGKGPTSVVPQRQLKAGLAPAKK